MRTRFFVSLCLAVALCGVGTVSAGPTEGGVTYETFGTDGALTISGSPESPYLVLDSDGEPVVAGITDASTLTIPVPNDEPSIDGVVLTVIVDDVVYAVVDPDWIWQQ